MCILIFILLRKVGSCARTLNAQFLLQTIFYNVVRNYWLMLIKNLILDARH